MRIVADRNMPFAAEAFATLGETVIRDGRGLTAPAVRDADVLAIRSTTHVNAALLEGSRVRFVGTATIGTDHMDIPYLESQGIGWCFSPGCNANSVSEYLVAALLHLAARHGFPLAGKTMGVIGVGNVGRRVVEKAKALGMSVLMSDPPRQRQAAAGGGAEEEAAAFVHLDDLLAASDVVTLHVPMTKEGPDRTYHLADARFFSNMRPGSVFINAARGAVVDTPALMEAIGSGHLAHTVLDTWEGEPAYREALLDQVDIGTPHIAGHSFEGKATGTEMVYRAVCDAFGQRPAWTLDDRLPPPPVPQAVTGGGSTEQVLDAVVRQVYDIMGDDARMRGRDVSIANAVHFDGLRKDYPMRREFRFTRAVCEHGDAALQAALRRLGFQTA